MKFSKRGFTLIELLVVISIVSTMASTVIVSVNGARVKGRDAQRISQIHEVQQALALYYSRNGVYPNNIALSQDGVPNNWQNMMRALNDGGFISATFTLNNFFESPHFSFIKIANAGVLPSHAPCSIQDPLYKTVDDYPYSYGYVASGDKKSYKIRINLEDAKSSLFGGSLSGTFLGAGTTGETACDANSNNAGTSHGVVFHYYCVGSIL